ncbi:MAG: response regulator [Sandaracinaceae bacterium]|nr:response regulator [Sandaracinaceae bacterium]
MSGAVNRPPAPGWTPPPASEADGRALVLYVDVDDETFEASSERLRRAYKLVRAQKDREACELIRRHERDLVAILMDVDMPGSVLDGVLLTRILRGRVPPQAVPPFARGLPSLDVPIVLVTGRADSYSDAEMVRYGGDRLMAKPVEMHKLTLTITEWHLQRAVRQ